MNTIIHREDVKAAIRKHHGTLEAFQQANGLKGQAVRDFLRGKSSAARSAVAKLLGVDPDHLVVTSERVPDCGTSSESASAHGLNSKAA